MHRGLLPITVLSLVLSACATREPSLPQNGVALELSETVFFPQRKYQCGPAALATVLHSAGSPTLPEQLVDQVYLPGKRGSLQIELLAAARRAGRIPYVIDRNLGALRAELAAGRPVLVLQNLGLGALPVWHYAVVIGLNPETDEIILRSGTERRQMMPAHRFLRSWRLAEKWGVVVLRPGELPARVDAKRYLTSVVRVERHLPFAQRRSVYLKALKRWPESSIARFGLAYAQHLEGDLRDAEKGYRDLLSQHPQHVAAYNNLAEVLNARGCHALARDAAEKALTIAREHQPAFVKAVGTTLHHIPWNADGPDCRARPAQEY